MRFRPKFVWLQAVVWAMMSLEGADRLFMYFRHGGGGLRVVMGLTQIFLGLICLYLDTFSWWVVDADGLTERKGCSSRTVAWSEIVRIGRWQPGNKPRTDWIEASFVRPGLFSSRGSIVLQPSDPIGLLCMLRSYAPQAEFDGFTIEA